MSTSRLPGFECGISLESLERKDSPCASSPGYGSVFYIPFCCFEITVPPCSLNPIAPSKYMLPVRALSIDLQVYHSHPLKTFSTCSYFWYPSRSVTLHLFQVIQHIENMYRILKETGVDLILYEL